MKTDDLENELRGLKLTHLTENELAAYEDHRLDQISRDRAEAHLRQCFICERQLKLLEEENAALSNRVITAEDEAFVERLMERTGLVEAARESRLRERLAQYLRLMVADWRLNFAQVQRGDQVWRWQSEDGRLVARATIEKNGDMVIDLSSTEVGLEGAKLRLGLGQFSQELTLGRVSESEVAAQIAIPWPYRRGGLADISIEIL
ncbi:MAG TPA: hypothetical protein VJZ91_08115 [Blastocatellia bacterium]|nr:hypothetical protein [Blastocatellia bacterium]